MKITFEINAKGTNQGTSAWLSTYLQSLEIQFGHCRSGEFAIFAKEKDKLKLVAFINRSDDYDAKILYYQWGTWSMLLSSPNDEDYHEMAQTFFDIDLTPAARKVYYDWVKTLINAADEKINSDFV
jgi:hypothetical protein